MVTATLANLGLCAACTPTAARFSRALHDPQRAQDQLLRRYLAAASDTAFGRECHLHEIRTYEAFARRVPIRDYDELLPWIDRIRRGEQNILTRDRVTRLVPTGGSTAGRKLIPWTRPSHRELHRAVAPWIVDLHRRFPGALKGCAYWSVTPLAPGDFDDIESAVPSGFDDDAAYLGRHLHRLVNAAMAVPPGLRDIASIESLRYVTLLLLLRRRDLSLISVWHPSFLDLLLDSLEDQFDRLIADVASGGCATAAEIPAGLRRVILSHPDPRRAHEIRSIGARNPTKLWPDLRIVSCWADGHAASAAASLGLRLPGVIVQPKGLLATEAAVSIPFAAQHPLAIRSHFFEFVDAAGRVKLPADLQIGQTYSIVLTTGSGLWRYRLHDLIRVTGTIARTPSVRFIGRGGLVSDRRGEKLSEGFVAGVLSRLFKAHPPAPTFALLAPEGAEGPDGGVAYILYMNAAPVRGLAESLDALLADNPQYAYGRRLGQLRPPRTFHIQRDAYAAYCARLTRGGQRFGDIKPAALSPLDDWTREFE